MSRNKIILNSKIVKHQSSRLDKIFSVKSGIDFIKILYYIIVSIFILYFTNKNSEGDVIVYKTFYENARNEGLFSGFLYMTATIGSYDIGYYLVVRFFSILFTFQQYVYLTSILLVYLFNDYCKNWISYLFVFTFSFLILFFTVDRVRISLIIFLLFINKKNIFLKLTPLLIHIQLLPLILFDLFRKFWRTEKIKLFIYGSILALTPLFLFSILPNFQNKVSSYRDGVNYDYFVFFYSVILIFFFKENIILKLMILLVILIFYYAFGGFRLNFLLIIFSMLSLNNYKSIGRYLFYIIYFINFLKGINFLIDIYNAKSGFDI